MVDFLSQREQVKTDLLPYAQRLYECISYGYSDYIEYDSPRGHIHNETVKANLIRSYIIHRVKQLLVEDSSIRLVENNKMLLLIIADRIAVRFKRLDEHLKSKNVKTKNVIDFRLHKLEVEGTELISLDAGYRLNNLRSEIEEIYFVCPDGDKNRWKLSATDLSVQKQVIELFEPVEEEIIPIISVKAHLKKDDNSQIDK